MRYHLTSVRMAVINKPTSNKCWRGCGERGIFLHCQWECRLVQPLYKAGWRYLKKLKMELPFDPAILLLGLYPKKPKTLIWKNISTPVFTAVLLTITEIQKQLKCPSLDEWIKQLWDIYTMEFYLVIKKKKILPFATVWMDLENMTLSEISQSEKDEYHLVSLMCEIWWTNWTNKQNRDRFIDGPQMTARRGVLVGVVIEQKGKRTHGHGQ